MVSRQVENGRVPTEQLGKNASAAALATQTAFALVETIEAQSDSVMGNRFNDGRLPERLHQRWLRAPASF